MRNKKIRNDWFTEKGELVIKDGFTLRTIKKNEIIVSYGKVL